MDPSHTPSEDERPVHSHHGLPVRFFRHRYQVVLAFLIFLVGLMITASGSSTERWRLLILGASIMLVGLVWLAVAAIAGWRRHRRPARRHAAPHQP